MANMEYKSTFGDYKLIYVFNCPYEDHKGTVKVGKASISSLEKIDDLTPNCQKLNSAANARIKQYTGTPGFRYDLLYTELAIDNKGKSFDDYAVHDVLLKSGIKKKKFDGTNANEWFITDTETVINAIQAVKAGRTSLNPNEKSTNHNPIKLRPEQDDAVKQTINHFKKFSSMLWNAKMRFGKTICSMELVKRLGENTDKYRKTIIITHRPDVINGWYEDFEKVFYDSSEYKFGSKVMGEDFNGLQKWLKESEHNKCIYFASIQDLRGSSAVQVDGKEGKFDKNNELFAENWDFLIVDEAHEGTQTSLGEEVINLLKKDNTKLLQLSGTPFNLLDKDDDKGVYTWDYMMEQRAKEEWKEELLGKNPYANLPRMNILTFDISGIDPKYSAYMDDKVFNFREFFKVDENGKFIHDSDVDAFLNLMVKKDEKSNYPFSTPEYRNNFKHTFWMVPGTKEAKALSEKIQNHKILSAFKVVNVAGDGDDNTNDFDDYEKESKALDQVKKTIKDYPDGTITLSCRRLSTGVTVPEWTAVFMLAGAYSTGAANYMQTIFRVQSPANINGRIKEECYVFDFAPDRTLKVIAEAVKISSGAGHTTTKDREIMQDLLHFCPIISYNGAQMATYDVNNMLQQLKRVYIDRAVKTGFDDNCLFNQNLLQLDNIDMQKFAALKEIIGGSADTKKNTDIIINDIGLTDENGNKIDKPEPKPKEPLTEEELARLEALKEAKKNRDTARSILKAIAIRIPMLIYGSNTDIDKNIDIDAFIDLMDNVSWDEFMPKGITKAIFREFSKYFDMDVFIGAGNEIRHRVQHADTLDPTNRVKYIAQLFACFKNPDKETVLTPWRVVNMHISETLGGYDFFNEKHDEFLIDDDKEPRYVNISEITDEVFGPKDTKILEINSKSGLYPLYITYTIWHKRCDEQKIDLKKVVDDKDIKKQVIQIWDNVIANNVFVICKTPMAKSITQRTLCGYRNVKINAHAFENLITMIKDGKSNKFIKKAKTGNTYNSKNKEKDMNFVAIVGNPPYQDGHHQIYPYFYLTSQSLGKYVSLIFPIGWQEPKDSNNLKMLNNNAIKNDKQIVFIDNRQNVFPGVAGAEWTNIILWKNGYNNELGGKQLVYINGENPKVVELIKDKSSIIKPEEINSIVNKVNSLKEKKIIEFVSARKPYGFEADPLDNPTKYGIIVKEVASNTTVRLFGKQNGKGRTYINIEKSGLPKVSPLLDTWKLFVVKAWGNMDEKKGFLGGSYSEIIVAEPKDCCSEMYLEVGPFKNKKEANNCKKYFYTKFFRAVFYKNKMSQNTAKETYQSVPMQDFTDKSDIDWSQSIAEIDQQLYKKYGLDQKEIDFIESMIKPME